MGKTELGILGFSLVLLALFFMAVCEPIYERLVNKNSTMGRPTGKSNPFSCLWIVTFIVGLVLLGIGISGEPGSCDHLGGFDYEECKMDQYDGYPR